MYIYIYIYIKDYRESIYVRCSGQILQSLEFDAGCAYAGAGHTEEAYDKRHTQRDPRDT